MMQLFDFKIIYFVQNIHYLCQQSSAAVVAVTAAIAATAPVVGPAVVATAIAAAIATAVAAVATAIWQVFTGRGSAVN